MVRPSFKDTVSESVEKLTAATRSSAFNAKTKLQSEVSPAKFYRIALILVQE